MFKYSEKITVIIPVYNTASYLRECLDSVVNQSYSNLEIIIVNDASTDSSKQIINQYQNQDNRIQVIHHKDNLGLGGARNSGLDITTGQYIFFLDSDDIIEKNALEIFYQKIVKYNADIVGCALRRTNEKNQQTLKIDFCHKQSELVFLDENIYNAYFNGKIPVNVATKLYRRKIWIDSKIRMPINIFHEDNYIFYDITSVCSKFVQINDILYRHRQHNKSITGRNISWKFMEDFLIALQKQKLFFQRGTFQDKTLQNSEQERRDTIRIHCIVPNNRTVPKELLVQMLNHAEKYDLKQEVFYEVAKNLSDLHQKLNKVSIANWWYDFGQASWTKRIKILAKKLFKTI